MKESWWIKGIVIVTLMIAIGAAVVMLLWNYTLPALTGLNPVTYWQALALLILARILFGRSAKWRGMHNGKCAQQIREKMEGITPEEKEKFRQYWEGRCNKWRSTDPSDH